MKEFHPHIVVAGLSDGNSERMKNVLRSVQKQFLGMGIRVFFTPENFSLSETESWVKDITDTNDFFLNFSFDEIPYIYFKGEAEQEMGEIFQNEISKRSEEEYEKIFPLSELNSETGNFLQNLPLHTFDIHFSPQKSDQELMHNIMACVTDICFLENTLVSEDSKWAFRDVPSYHFASSAIKKAKEKGIIPGYKGDIIYPNGGITRGEVIYMLEKIGMLS